MKIIILGGTGFIGTALGQRLADHNHKIISISRQPPTSADHRIQYHTGSYDDQGLLKNLLPHCNYIFHLASGTNPGSSYMNPSIEVVENILPTSRLLEILPKYCDAHLVYISSGGAIYSEQQSNHGYCDEESPIAPISYYGSAKIAIEKILYAYHRQTGSDVSVLRPSNLYGPGQFQKSNFGLIQTLINAAIKSVPVEIWGNGMAIRDYLFIDDFTTFCTKLCLKKKEAIGYETYNVGSGKGHTIREVCKIVEKTTKTHINKKYLSKRSIDLDKIILNCKKARNAFDWKAETDLSIGIHETWKWQNKVLSNNC